MPDICEVHIPGSPVVPAIFTDGPKAGQFKSGAQEYIDWHNAAYRTGFVYVPVKHEALVVAFYLLANYSFSFSAGELTFVEHKLPTNQPVRNVFPKPPPGLISFSLNLAHMVKAVFADPAKRPAIGHNKHPLPFLECLAQKACDALSPASQVSLGKFVASVELYREDLLSKMSVRFISVTKNFNSIPLDCVRYFLSTPFEFAGFSFKTHRNVTDFVTVSRAHLRDVVDLPRKSDTPGWGKIAASATSVPFKIFAAIDALERMSGPIDGRVDAYGTGYTNHWHRVVERSSPEGVTFYDRDPKRVPPLGGSFHQGDVETLLPGSKEGWILFDDTFNGVDGCTPDKLDFTAKIKSIIRADYFRGFVKLYLGAGSDGPTPLKAIPPSIKLMMDHYSHVVLSPGGSPHSPEFFLVFSHTCIPDWRVPSYSDKGFLSFRDGEDRNVYVVRWLGARMLEMIVSNAMINAQVVSSCFASQPFQWPTYFGIPSTMEVPLSGTLVHSATISAKEIAPAPLDEFDV